MKTETRTIQNLLKLGLFERATKKFINLETTRQEAVLGELRDNLPNGDFYLLVRNVIYNLQNDPKKEYNELSRL